MSNITSDDHGDSFCSGEVRQQQQNPSIRSALDSTDKKGNLPGTPDPSTEVVALSPTALMATNTFFCEICRKGFQREQNLQLHRRAHKLIPMNSTNEVRKRVYVCPEPSCMHHSPDRALLDVVEIKKHYRKKHGQDFFWECEKCHKKYKVTTDREAHQKTCGTIEYKCHCGAIFSRKDRLATHRAFCFFETSKASQALLGPLGRNPKAQFSDLMSIIPNMDMTKALSEFKPEDQVFGPNIGPKYFQSPNDQSPSFQVGFEQNTTQEMAAQLFQGGLLRNGRMLIEKKNPSIEFVSGKGFRAKPITQTRSGGSAIRTVDFLELRQDMHPETPSNSDV